MLDVLARGLRPCKTTQVREYGKGASLFGYTSLYGAVPGGQAEYSRVPHADFGPVKIPDEGPDERWLYLSDILPTAWQAFEYADVPDEGTVAVFGLGPVGQLTTRIARHAGRLVGVDRIPERLALAASYGAETVDLDAVDDVTEAVFDLTAGAVPTAPSTRWGWRRTARPWPRPPSARSGSCPTRWPGR